MPNGQKLPYKIYQRTGTSNWWIRFSIPGEGQIAKSLETPDEQAASEKAFEIYAEHRYRHKNGLSSRAKTFRQIAAEYIDRLEKEVERGERRKHQLIQYRGIINRYFSGYFADKQMSQITEAQIERYWEWRKSYWTTGPGRDITEIVYERNGRRIKRPVVSKKQPPTASSLRSEGVLLRQLLKQASRWGYMKVSDIPEIETPEAAPNPRPGFEANEFDYLLELAYQRLWRDERDPPNQFRDRVQLHSFIHIAAYSGCRPTELKNLKWGDVLNYLETRPEPGRPFDADLRDIRLRVYGKKKRRRVAPITACIPSFDILWDLWEKEHGAEPSADDFVFVSHTGQSKLPTEELNKLLTAAGLLRDYTGNKRTSYSFRHFYITQMLLARVGVFAIAQNCGTSAEMIEKFYSHVRMEDMVHELRPEWRRQLNIEQTIVAIKDE